MHISYCSSDVCASDLAPLRKVEPGPRPCRQICPYCRPRPDLLHQCPSETTACPCPALSRCALFCETQHNPLCYWRIWHSYRIFRQMRFCANRVRSSQSALPGSSRSTSSALCPYSRVPTRWFQDRKRVVRGKRGSVRDDAGGRRIINKNK